MITNIVDDRKNKYAWKEVWGTVEPTCNDNSIKCADKADGDRNRIGFIEMTRKTMSLNEVLVWASQFDGENTLYIRNDDPMGRKEV